ncbi:MAG: hypothetical protein M0R06_01230 [Sphaerochaeta sp.]|nr:hypothetical protein [Sphaerochaeta sp.]
MNIAIGEIKEVIGSIFTPALEEGAIAVAKLAESIKLLLDNLPIITDTAGYVSDAIKVWAKNLDNLNIIIKAVTDSSEGWNLKVRDTYLKEASMGALQLKDELLNLNYAYENGVQAVRQYDEAQRSSTQGMDAYGQRLTEQAAALTKNEEAWYKHFEGMTKTASDAYSQMAIVEQSSQATLAKLQADYYAEANNAAAQYANEQAALMFYAQEEINALLDAGLTEEAAKVQAATENKLGNLQVAYDNESALARWHYEVAAAEANLARENEMTSIRNDALAKMIVATGLSQDLLGELATRYGLQDNMIIKQAEFEMAVEDTRKMVARQYMLDEAEKAKLFIDLMASKLSAIYDFGKGYQQVYNDLMNNKPVTAPPMPAMPDMSKYTGSGGGGGTTPVSPVEAIEDTVSKTASAIKAGIEAIAKLLNYTAPKAEELKEKAKQLAESLNIIIVEMVHAAWEFGGEGRDWRDIPKASAEFAGWAGQAASGMGSGLDALMKIVEWDGKVGDIATKAKAIADNIGIFITELIHIAWTFGDAERDWRDIPKAAAEFAGYVQPAMAAISAAASAITAVAEGKQVSAIRVEKFLGNLRYITKRFMEEFGTKDKDYYKVISEWAPNVEAAMSLLGNAANAITSVMDGKQVSAARVDKFLGNLWYVLVEFSEKFGKIGKNWYSVIKEWAPNAEKAFSFLGNAASAITAITEGKQVSAKRVDTFINNLWYILDRMGKKFGGYGKDWLSKIANWAPNAEKAISLLGNAASAITSIMEGKQVSAARVDIFLNNLWYVLTRFAAKFSDPNDPTLYGAGWYSTIAQWAPNAEKAMSLLVGAADAITAIINTKQVSSTRVDQFLNNLWYVLTRFAAKFSDPNNKDLYGPGWFSIIAKWAPNAEAALSLLVGAADAITAVVEGKSVSADKVDKFLENLWQVLKAFSEKFGPQGLDIGKDWYSVVAQWAPNVQKGVELISAAAEAMSSMAMSLLPTLPKIQAFIETLRQVLDEFATALAEEVEKGFSAEGEFAENAKKVFEGISSALDSLDKLAEFEGGKWITPQKIDIMLDMMRYLLDSAIWLASLYEADALDAAVVFSVKAKELFDMFKSALDALGSLAEATAPDEDKLREFVEMLARMLALLQTAANITEQFTTVDPGVRDFGDDMGGFNVNKGGARKSKGDDNPAKQRIPWVDLLGRTNGGGGGGGGNTAETYEMLELLVDIRDVLITIAMEVTSDTAREKLAHAFAIITGFNKYKNGRLNV